MNATAKAVAEEVEAVVTTAKAQDALRVLALIRDWQASCAAMLPEVDETDALSWVVELMCTGRIYLAHLTGGKYNGDLAGVLAIQDSAFPWNRHVHMFQIPLFYVPPAYRDLGVAQALCTKVQALAASRNHPLLLPLVSGAKNGRNEKGYGLTGGVQVGVTYAYGLGE